MAEETCSICGRKLDVEDTGLATSDETKAEEGQCLHCHFCMYEDCHIFLNRLRWLCGECRALND